MFSTCPITFTHSPEAVEVASKVRIARPSGTNTRSAPIAPTGSPHPVRVAIVWWCATELRSQLQPRTSYSTRRHAAPLVPTCSVKSHGASCGVSLLATLHAHTDTLQHQNFRPHKLCRPRNFPPPLLFRRLASQQKLYYLLTNP